MCEKRDRSKLFTSTEKVSKTYLVVGFCQNIRTDLTDYKEMHVRKRLLLLLWNGTIVCYTCLKELHDGMHDGK